ncbi:MAG: hypothetical protein KGI33_09960 [Thaumarchaeota archaeon]|nr:hypothetical protein [Nitrososphaerota archaeon]
MASMLGIRAGKNYDAGETKHGIHESVYTAYLEEMLVKARERLKKLRADPAKFDEQIREAEDEIEILESLHENFDASMDVFGRME